VEYWTDGKQARIILITRGYQLVSLDAKTGLPDPAFGRNGVIDLYQDFDQPPPQDGVISSTSPAVVVRNVIVIGAAMVGGTAPRSKENTKGYIRGFDVRTGKRLWTFHTIPQPGEFGNDTWLNDSWSYRQRDGLVAVLCRRRAGAAPCLWNPPRATTTVGIVLETICSRAASPVSMRTESVWHQFNITTSGITIASPLTLINITVNGKLIRAVAQTTKWSYLFASIV
jgi:quinoprotein glucose dehydrogenase